MGRGPGQTPSASSPTATRRMVTSYCPDGGCRGRRCSPARASRAGVLLRHGHPGHAGAARGGRGAALSRAQRPRPTSISSSASPAARRSTSCASVWARARVAPLYGSVDPTVHRPHRACRPLSGRSLLPRHLCRRPAGGAGGAASSSRRGGCRTTLPHRRRAVSRATSPGPPNIFFVRHLPPAEHPAFFASSRMTLNITRRRHGARWAGAPRAGSSKRPPAARPPQRLVGGARRFLRAGRRDPRRALSGRSRSARSPRATRSSSGSPRSARERALAEHTADRRADGMREPCLRACARLAMPAPIERGSVMEA